MPVFLIGYMGSGKSTIGSQLSKLMNTPFLDLDNLIEKELNMTVCDIFSKQGEVFFRQKEQHYLTTFDYTYNPIVAVGGGTPCFFDNNNFMNSRGITVYLKVSCQELFNRLEFSKQRPLLCNNKLNLKDFIKEQLIQREKYYEKSQYIIQSDCISVEQVFQILN